MRFLKGLAATVLVASACAFSPGHAYAADLVDLRLGVTAADKTRIVFDLKGPAAFSLAAADVGQGRLDVLLNGVKPAAGAPAALPGRGQVAGVRIAPATEQGLTITVDLKRPARVAAAFVIPPSAQNPLHRLVVDLEASTMAAFLASAPRRYSSIAEVIEAVAPPQATAAGAPAVTAPTPVQDPAATASAVAAAAKPVAAKPVIVIDPGHGGADPGAIGPTGVKESVVTLAAAKTLAEILAATGRYTVVLTREGDTRVAHDERSERARAAKADLFISLHADAHTDPKVRGGSVYTISREGAERSAREALNKDEAWVFDVNIAETDPQVGGLLYSLAQRETGTESARYADLLVARLKGTAPLVNNSHRTGNFKVLLAPDVPAVLFEIAFMSNDKDESNLNSAEWRKKTMAAVAASIDDYFSSSRTQRRARLDEGAGR